MLLAPGLGNKKPATPEKQSATFRKLERAFTGTNFPTTPGCCRIGANKWGTLSQLGNWQERARAFNANTAVRSEHGRTSNRNFVDKLPATAVDDAVLAGDFGAMEEMHAFSREMLISSSVLRRRRFNDATSCSRRSNGLADVVPGTPATLLLTCSSTTICKVTSTGSRCTTCSRRCVGQRQTCVNDDGIFEIDPTAQVTVNQWIRICSSTAKTCSSVDDVSGFDAFVVVRQRAKSRLVTAGVAKQTASAVTGDDVTVSTFVNTNNMFNGTPDPQTM